MSNVSLAARMDGRIMYASPVAPVRRDLLTFSHDTPLRRRLIVERANYLVGGDMEMRGNNDNPSTSRRRTEHQSTTPNISPEDLYGKVHQCIENWERTREAHLLRRALWRLLRDNSHFRRINKVVCFGLGGFTADKHNPDSNSSMPQRGGGERGERGGNSWGLRRKTCRLYGVALAIADVCRLYSCLYPSHIAIQTPHETSLLGTRLFSRGISIKLYVHDLSSSRSSCSFDDDDVAILSRLGFVVLNAEYGMQEGFVMVDEHTLVLSAGGSDNMDSSDRIRQLVCETSRPAAMLWPDAMWGSISRIWVRLLLVAEYEKAYRSEAEEGEGEGGCLDGNMAMYVRNESPGRLAGCISYILGL